jgi:hypothetical protein
MACLLVSAFSLGLFLIVFGRAAASIRLSLRRRLRNLRLIHESFR